MKTIRLVLLIGALCALLITGYFYYTEVYLPAQDQATLIRGN